jgi:hypothetical protein
MMLKNLTGRGRRWCAVAALALGVALPADIALPADPNVFALSIRMV